MNDETIKKSYRINICVPEKTEEDNPFGTKLLLHVLNFQLLNHLN